MVILEASYFLASGLFSSSFSMKILTQIQQNGGKGTTVVLVSNEKAQCQGWCGLLHPDLGEEDHSISTSRSEPNKENGIHSECKTRDP